MKRPTSRKFRILSNTGVRDALEEAMAALLCTLDKE